MKGWKRTGDSVGHAPTFDISCRFCGDIMYLRDSVIYLDSIVGRMTKPYNFMQFKCFRCGNVIQFDVDEDKEYLEKVMGLRGGTPILVPDAADWTGESVEVRRQLEALGYIGGR